MRKSEILRLSKDDVDLYGQMKRRTEYSEWFARFDVHELTADGNKGVSLGTLSPSPYVSRA